MNKVFMLNVLNTSTTNTKKVKAANFMANDSTA